MKVTVKYWLYSPCCTIYPCGFFILHRVVDISQSPASMLPLPQPPIPSLGTAGLSSVSVSLFRFRGHILFFF